LPGAELALLRFGRLALGISGYGADADRETR
jgi:hypothetical protein